MPDKKLTDNEITIKALKEILELMLCEGDLQRVSTISHTIDLINRLQAENERLRNAYKQCAWERDTFTEIKKEEIEKLVVKTKAEAYKEFAESLCEDRVSNDPVVIAAKCLLKEMVGEDNG